MNTKEPSGGSGKFYRDITKSSLPPFPPQFDRNKPSTDVERTFYLQDLVIIDHLG